MKKKQLASAMELDFTSLQVSNAVTAAAFRIYEIEDSDVHKALTDRFNATFFPNEDNPAGVEWEDIVLRIVLFSKMFHCVRSCMLTGVEYLSNMAETFSRGEVYYNQKNFLTSSLTMDDLFGSFTTGDFLSNQTLKEYFDKDDGTLMNDWQHSVGTGQNHFIQTDKASGNYSIYWMPPRPNSAFGEFNIAFDSGAALGDVVEKGLTKYNAATASKYNAKAIGKGMGLLFDKLLNATKLYVQQVLGPNATDTSSGSERLSTLHSFTVPLLKLGLPSDPVIATAVQKMPYVKKVVEAAKEYGALPKHMDKLFKMPAFRFGDKATIGARHSDTRAKAADPAYKAPKRTTDLPSLLMAQVGIGFMQSVGQDIVRYVTQTQTGKISLSTFNGWVTIYGRSFIKEDDETVAPDFVMPYRESAEFFKQEQFKLGRPRKNDMGLSIDAQGHLIWTMNPSDERAGKYQAVLDELTELNFAVGNPVNTKRLSEDPDQFLDDPARLLKVGELKKGLNQFKGSPIMMNWSLNRAITPMSELGDMTSSIDLSSAISADDRSIADMAQKPLNHLLEYLNRQTEETNAEEYATPAASLTQSPYIRDLLKVFHVFSDCGEVEDMKALALKEFSKRGFTSKGSSVITIPPTSHEQQLWDDVIGPEGKISSEHFCLVVHRSITRASGGDSWSFAQARTKKMPESDLPSYVCEQSEMTLTNLHEIADKYSAVAILLAMCGVVRQRLQKTPHAMEEVTANPKFHDAQERHGSVSFDRLTKIMPLACMLEHYSKPEVIRKIIDTANTRTVAGKPQAQDKVQTIKEGIKLSPTLPVKDTAFFPHQLSAYRVLDRTADNADFERGEAHVAVADISPGGGKTILDLMDLLNLLVKKKIKRPMICAPGTLVMNWKKDLDQITDKNFNIVVITSKSWNRWKPERMRAMLKRMPLNTLLIVSTDWISNTNKDNVVLMGTTPIQVFPNVLMLQECYQPDYIALDESHFVKNAGTKKFNAMDMLISGRAVRYIRLLSGTIVTDKLSDLVGQCRLINPYIFRDLRNFQRKYRTEDGLGWKPGSGGKIRNRMNSFCTVMTVKKKEWAFMLPYPVEKICPVDMPAEFKDMYEALLKKAIDDLKHGTPAQRKIYQYLVDGDESKADAIEAVLSDKLERLEQFLIDPDNDPMALEAGKKLPPSPKIHHPKHGIIARLDAHFATKSDNPKANKVLIFCRYYRSVAAVMEGLPAKYKKMAGVYTGQNKTNLEPFLDPDSGMNILVCTEMSINTGKNLQIASRIIRVETPWSPGELDQAQSRVMRPTPPKVDAQGNVTDHAFKREKIYLDWIFMDDSMEVSKMGRLISKIVSKAQFDEYGNDRYADLPEVPMVRMSLDSFKTFRTLKDLGVENNVAKEGSYLDGYQKFKNAELADFDEYRKTALSSMIPVKQGNPIENAVKLDFELPEVDEAGNSNKPPKDDIADLMDSQGKKKVIKKPPPGSKPQGDSSEPETVTVMKKVRVRNPKTGKVRVVEKEVEIPNPRYKAPKPVKDGKPVKAPKEEPTRESNKKKLHDNPDTSENGKVYLFCEIIAGMYTLVVEDTEEDFTPKIAKQLNFRPISQMVYANLPTSKRFNEMVEALDANGYIIAPKQRALIDEFAENYKGKIANPTLAKRIDLQEFFFAQRKVNPDPKKIRLYPVIRDQGIFLMGDVASQKAAQMLAKRKVLKGSPVRWELENGAHMYVGTSKNDLRAKYKELQKLFEIDNPEEVEEFFGKLKR